MKFIIIDVGTSSMRGVLYNEKAEILFMHQIQYDVLYLSETEAEQSPKDWENVLIKIISVISSYCKKQGISVDVLSMTCQRSSIIPVDADGTPLRNAIMWLDKRNSNICEELKPHEAEIVRLSGARINAIFAGSKITWVKRNEREIYDGAYKIMTIADYLAYLMTGEFKTDQTYASRTSLMNIRTRQWDARLLELYEVDKDKLCEIIAPGAVLGTVSESFASETGLTAGIPLISAGGDQQCAALGLGVLKKGDMEITTGTGTFMLAAADRVPEELKSEVICGAHAVPGCYVMESSMLSCASLYDWFRKNFYQEETNSKAQILKINHEVESVVAGADGCLALPYFQGRGTPDFNTSATGCFVNLTLNTTRQSMARAILESIALEAKNNIEILERYTGISEKLYISGGLTQFEAFDQMQADVYQKTLIQYVNAEQTALGAWISAAVTMGLFPDYESAVRVTKESDQVREYTPDETKQEVYEHKRQKMNTLYAKLS